MQKHQIKDNIFYFLCNKMIIGKNNYDTSIKFILFNHLLKFVLMSFLKISEIDQNICNVIHSIVTPEYNIITLYVLLESFM